MADEPKKGPGRPPNRPFQVVAAADPAPAAVRPDVVVAAPKLPASVTLDSLYGYFHEVDGLLRLWQSGTVVTDPDEIADLIARKAPLKG